MMSGWEIALRCVVLPIVIGFALGLSRTGVAAGWSVGSQDASTYKGWVVSSLIIQGVEKDLASELRRGLALSGQRRLIRTRRPLLYPPILRDDIRRASLFLARAGYPYARIQTRFEPARTGRKIAVVLDVHPGSPVLVESVSVERFPPRLEHLASGCLLLHPGSVFSEPKLERSTRALEFLLKEDGHARAMIDRAVERLDSTRVRVRLVAEPGPVYRFDDVTVEGVAEDLVALARKTIEVRQGERYSPAAIERAQDNLRLLGLFRQIRLATRDTGPTTLTLHANLLERAPRTVELGVGYWTDDLFRAHARWEHRNLFRGGRGMDIGGSYSRFVQDVGVSFWWPALWGSRTRGVIAATAERQQEESYELLSTGLELGVRYRHSLLTTVRAGVTVSKVEVEVKTKEAGLFGEEGGLLTALSAGWSRDSANDRVYPTVGTVSWVRMEWAPPGWLTESHFVSTETAGAVYVALVGATVLAGRLGVGIAAPTGESVDLLPNKRFYAGGATSMRGFKRRKLGPADRSGAPVGGEAKLEASVELRVPLAWRFRGALFVDAGQVWAKRDQMSLDDLEYAAGPGIMILTPVGPVRADVGFRITDRIAREPDWVAHVTIGHPF